MVRWEDGAWVRVEASAESPETEVAVRCEGEAQRLTPGGKLFAAASVGFLEWWMRNAARRTGGTVEVEATGEFERWAE